MISNIKIVAFLSNPVALSNDWNPSFDAILSHQILFNAKMLKQNPDMEQIKAGLIIIKENIPLEIGYLSSDKTSWYYKTSSPYYFLQKNHNLGNGTIKPWRVTSQITWYCRADLQKLEELLEYIHFLGKYKTMFYSGIKSWLVEELIDDYHLWKNDKLSRPVPCIYLQKDSRIFLCDYKVKDWGWRCPSYLPDNQARCYMPLHNVSYE
jgi:hypothetical protein